MAQVQTVTQEQYNELLNNAPYALQFKTNKADFVDSMGNVKQERENTLNRSYNLKELYPHERPTFKAVTYKRGLYMLVATVNTYKYVEEETTIQGLTKVTTELYINGEYIQSFAPRYEYTPQQGLVTINLSVRDNWEERKREFTYEIDAGITSRRVDIDNMKQYARETAQAAKTMEDIVNYLQEHGETVTAY